MKIQLTILLSLLLLAPSLFGQLAPDFTISATDGQDHSLYADYLDQNKTVVLKLMFVACPACNAIAPSLQDLYEEWGEGNEDVEFFSMSILSIDDNADIHDYETMHDLTFTGAGNDGGAMAALMPYTSGTFGSFFATPTFAVIAPDRSVQWDPRGSGQAATIDSLDAAIAATGAVKPGTQGPLLVGGEILTEAGAAVNNVQIQYTNGNEQVSLSSMGDGSFLFSDVPFGSSPLLIPQKDTNASNGVNIFDVFLIQNHILNITPLDSPYKIIAADVNSSNAVNISDIFLLQRLILNIDTVFSQTPSWRFVVSDHVFDPLAPVYDAALGSIQYNNLSESQLAADFIAIKTGDVTGSADPSTLQATTDTRHSMPLIFNTPDISLVAGESYVLDFKAPALHQYLGYQFTLQFDAQIFEIEEVLFTERSMEMGLSTNNFGFNHLENGALTTLWTTTQLVSPDPEAVIFQVKINAIADAPIQQAMNIGSSITPAVAIFQDGTEANLELEYMGLTSTETIVTQPAYSIYPNPTSDQLFVSNSGVTPTKQNVLLYNAMGQLVKTFDLENAPNSSTELSLEGLNNGIYLLEIREKDQSVFQSKIVLQKGQ
ncbi:MAG: T9SS type A sorting domain-containing protein [Bacteroidota bacterium]